MKSDQEVGEVSMSKKFSLPTDNVTYDDENNTVIIETENACCGCPSAYAKITNINDLRTLVKFLNEITEGRQSNDTHHAESGG